MKSSDHPSNLLNFESLTPSDNQKLNNSVQTRIDKARELGDGYLIIGSKIIRTGDGLTVHTNLLNIRKLSLQAQCNELNKQYRKPKPRITNYRAVIV